MTKLFERAIATMRDLPAETQDGLARIILSLTSDELRPIELSEAEAASFEESLGQASRREFADEEQVKAVWSKHGL